MYIKIRKFILEMFLNCDQFKMKRTPVVAKNVAYKNINKYNICLLYKINKGKFLENKNLKCKRNVGA